MGGFHLALQPGKPAIAGQPEEIEFIGAEMIRTGVKQVYTGHCTGEAAYAILKKVMGRTLCRLHTGARLSI